MAELCVSPDLSFKPTVLVVTPSINCAPHAPRLRCIFASSGPKHPSTTTLSRNSLCLPRTSRSCFSRAAHYFGTWPALLSGPPLSSTGGLGRALRVRPSRPRSAPRIGHTPQNPSLFLPCTRKRVPGVFSKAGRPLQRRSAFTVMRSFVHGYKNSPRVEYRSHAARPGTRTPFPPALPFSSFIPFLHR